MATLANLGDIPVDSLVLRPGGTEKGVTGKQKGKGKEKGKGKGAATASHLEKTYRPGNANYRIQKVPILRFSFFFVLHCWMYARLFEGAGVTTSSLCCSFWITDAFCGVYRAMGVPGLMKAGMLHVRRVDHGECRTEGVVDKGEFCCR